MNTPWLIRLFSIPICPTSRDTRVYHDPSTIPATMAMHTRVTKPACSGISCENKAVKKTKILGLSKEMLRPVNHAAGNLLLRLLSSLPVLFQDLNAR